MAQNLVMRALFRAVAARRPERGFVIILTAVANIAPMLIVSSVSACILALYSSWNLGVKDWLIQTLFVRTCAL